MCLEVFLAPLSMISEAWKKNRVSAVIDHFRSWRKGRIKDRRKGEEGLCARRQKEGNNLRSGEDKKIVGRALIQTAKMEEKLSLFRLCLSISGFEVSLYSRRRRLKLYCIRLPYVPERREERSQKCGKEGRKGH